MSNQLTLTIPVENGKLKPSEQQHFAMESFLHRRDGKAVTVKFSVPTNTRTLSQNKFYWSVPIALIAESTGHTPEEIHLAIKDMFLPRKFIRLGAREVEIRKTTTDLTTTEFENYLTAIRALASTELGIAIPLPNEV